jgi:Zn-dependent protease with chaperone function
MGRLTHIGSYSLVAEISTRSIKPRPAVGFFLSAIALPLLSLLLAGSVEARLAESDPDVARRAIALWVFLAVVTIAIGAVWSIAVPVLVSASRGRPWQLLFVLGPVARLGLAGLAAIVLLEGLLAAAIVLGLELLIFGRAFGGTAAPILIGCFAGVYYLSVGTSGQIAVEPLELAGLQIDLDREPRLAALIDDLSRKLQVDRPDRVIVGPSLDCFVTESTLRVRNELVEGRSLYLSWPLSQLLTSTQLCAVVAHEFAHFAGGHTGEGPRIVRGVARIQAAIGRLREEREPFPRLSIQPALLWLEHLDRAVVELASNVVRSGELEADRTAAGVIGSEDLRSALVATKGWSTLGQEWNGLVEQARRSDGSLVDALRQFRGFAEAHQDGLGDEAHEVDLLDASLGVDGPFTERLAALAVMDGESVAVPDMPDEPAFGQPEKLAAEILAAMAPTDQRHRSMIVNPARFDIGLAGWLTTAILFTAFFVGIFVTGTRLFARGNAIPIVLVIEGPIALFPVIYLALQREVRFGPEGVEIRSWMAALLRRPSRLFGWGPALALDVGQSMLLSLGDGRRKTRMWADVWAKREFWRLVDACRRRDMPVRFGRRAHGLDDERRAVVWFAGNVLLLPRVLRTDDGRLIEARPIAQASIDSSQFADALSAALARAPRNVDRSTTHASSSELARLAGLEILDFEREARRLTIGGYQQGWTIAVDDGEKEWSTSGPIDPRLAAVIALSMLDIYPERGADEADNDGAAAIEAAPAD